MAKNKINTLLLNRIMFVLAIVGILIAVYVTQSFLRQVGIICATGGCELVRKSPASYIYGVPVPAVGLVGYSLLAIFSFLRTTGEKPWMLKAMLGIAIFGILFVSWFTDTELFVIKGVCTWCAISTVNMYVIFEPYALRSKLSTLCFSTPKSIVFGELSFCIYYSMARNICRVGI